jgi:hypothetical protein
MYRVCSALRLLVPTALNLHEVGANQEVAIAPLTRYLRALSTVSFHSACTLFWLHGSPPSRCTSDAMQLEPPAEQRTGLCSVIFIYEASLSLM